MRQIVRKAEIASWVLALVGIIVLAFALVWLTDRAGAQQVTNGGGAAGALSTYTSGTVTASIAATTLCSTTNCPAATYLISVYVNETGTGCTTVTSGAVKIQLNYINGFGQTESSAYIPMPTSTLTTYAGTGMSFTTTGIGNSMGTYVVNTNGTAVAASDAIQVLSTVTACATPGSWTGYQVRGYVQKIG